MALQTSWNWLQHTTGKNLSQAQQSSSWTSVSQSGRRTPTRPQPPQWAPEFRQMRRELPQQPLLSLCPWAPAIYTQAHTSMHVPGARAGWGILSQSDTFSKFQRSYLLTVKAVRQGNWRKQLRFTKDISDWMLRYTWKYPERSSPFGEKIRSWTYKRQGLGVEIHVLNLSKKKKRRLENCCLPINKKETQYCSVLAQI